MANVIEFHLNQAPLSLKNRTLILQRLADQPRVEFVFARECGGDDGTGSGRRFPREETAPVRTRAVSTYPREVEEVSSPRITRRQRRVYKNRDL